MPGLRPGRRGVAADLVGDRVAVAAGVGVDDGGREIVGGDGGADGARGARLLAYREGPDRASGRSQAR